MEVEILDKSKKQLVKVTTYPLYFLYIFVIDFYFLQMYGLYDKEGILRFVDSDKDACIAYAELFELSSTNYCLMDLDKDIKQVKVTNLDQSLGGNNN